MPYYIKYGFLVRVNDVTSQFHRKKGRVKSVPQMKTPMAVIDIDGEDVWFAVSQLVDGRDNED